MTDLIEALARRLEDISIVPKSTARDILFAIDAAGYTVVPKEMTEEMFTSALKADMEAFGNETPIFAIYAAILAAAPKVKP